MADNSEVVTTAVDEAVAEPVSSTAQPAAVSTQTIPTSQPQPKASDPERRIASLQSQADKMRAERDSAILERATLQQQFDKTLKEANETISQAALATQAALEKSKALAEENANLQAKLTRSQFLVEHPDLLDYQAVIPASADRETLDNLAKELQAAREKDLERMRQQVRPGSVVPPANPQRVGAEMSPSQLHDYLNEAKDNPKLFQERLREVAAKLKTS